MLKAGDFAEITGLADNEYYLTNGLAVRLIRERSRGQWEVEFNQPPPEARAAIKYVSSQLLKPIFHAQIRCRLS